MTTTDNRFDLDLAIAAVGSRELARKIRTTIERAKEHAEEAARDAELAREFYERIRDHWFEVPASEFEPDGRPLTFAYGIAEGYPACCVVQFCREFNGNRKDVRRRSFAQQAANLDHVPCSACADRIL